MVAGIFLKTKKTKKNNAKKQIFTTLVLKLTPTPVAPVAYQVILESGVGQFREFEPRRVHAGMNSLGLFLVHKLTCGKRESMS